MTYKNQLREFSIEFLSGVNNLEPFQNWVQANLQYLDQTELAFVFPLLDADLSTESSLLVAQHFENTYTDVFNAPLDRDKAEYILTQVIGDKGDLVSWCHKLADLMRNGIDFLPIEFSGFSSELEDVPLESEMDQWNKSAYDEKRTKVLLYTDQIKALATKTLDQLR